MDKKQSPERPGHLCETENNNDTPKIWFSHESHSRESSINFRTEQFFARKVNGLLDVAQDIRKHLLKAKRNSWRSVSIPFIDAECYIEQIEDSSQSVTEVYKATTQALQHANINQKLWAGFYERSCESSLSLTIKNFSAGRISKEDLSAAITNFIRPKKSA